MQKTYLKLLRGAVKHLVVGPASEGVTLCGCSVTQVPNWKQIMSLEGDECPRCAERAFSPAGSRSFQQP